MCNELSVTFSLPCELMKRATTQFTKSGGDSIFLMSPSFKYCLLSAVVTSNNHVWKLFSWLFNSSAQSSGIKRLAPSSLNVLSRNFPNSQNLEYAFDPNPSTVNLMIKIIRQKNKTIYIYRLLEIYQGGSFKYFIFKLFLRISSSFFLNSSPLFGGSPSPNVEATNMMACW